jgi:DNA-binding transcriptional MocR family regulator
MHGAAAGMHLAITLQKGTRDRDIAARAAQERLWLWPLSPSYLGETARQGFVLGFGSTSAAQIPRAVGRLKALCTE